MPRRARPTTSATRFWPRSGGSPPRREPPDDLLLQSKRNQFRWLGPGADGEGNILLAALHIGHWHAAHHAGYAHLAEHRAGPLVIGAHDMLAAPALARDQQSFGHQHG